MRTVTITDETSVARGAFYNCSMLTSVTLNEGITSLGALVFYKCTGLTSVTIPNSVTSIGGSLLNGCSSIVELTLPFIGSERGNNETNDSYFGYIFGVSEFTGSSAAPTMSDVEYQVAGSLRTVHITDETIVADSAFWYCDMITTITLNEGITAIGSYAFNSCSNLANLTIPSSVSGMPANVFIYCSGLESITFQGRTIEQVSGMTGYPWGISPSIFNVAQ